MLFLSFPPPGLLLLLGGRERTTPRFGEPSCLLALAPALELLAPALLGGGCAVLLLCRDVFPFPSVRMLAPRTGGRRRLGARGRGRRL